MAYRSHTASPAGSASPSTSSSTNASPYINTSTLDMGLNDDHDSSYSAHGTPDHSTTSLPRSLSAGKGGCWTCRVRRKKCDEQREGDSCKTCKRLTIKCLGWGPKRPDWMRDKRNVDAYKASIKAQLSRAGLIRGQPRHNHHPIQVPSHRGTAVSSRQSAAINLPTTTSNGTNRVFNDIYNPQSLEFSQSQQELLLPSTLSGVSNPGFEQFSRTFGDIDPMFQFNQPMSNPLGFVDDFNVPDMNGFVDNTPLLQFPNQPSGQEALVMHYFDTVQKVQPFFTGEALTDVTYGAIVNEPHGAVTLAVCALADLHSKQMRISHGLEAPSATEASHATYLKNEALLKLETNKNTHGTYSETDAVAALHLVSLSQLSGGGGWETPLDILCQWLQQLNLHLEDDPWRRFSSLAPTTQHLVKSAMWLDIISSLSVLRPPKFFVLWQSLLGDQAAFWSNDTGLELPRRMRMDLLTGCPDEALLVIAEVSNLAHWKASQLHNHCLSYPELVRRGTMIDNLLRNPAPLHIDQATRVLSSAGVTPSEEDRVRMANTFRETAKLYLHTVLSNSAPGVPEISTSVDTLVRLFTQVPQSELDRTLVFPICLAACMTNDSSRREFFKGRLRSMNENFGNLLTTRRLMEAVWQKRDVSGREVDFRETIREQGLKLLLI